MTQTEFTAEYFLVVGLVKESNYYKSMSITTAIEHMNELMKEDNYKSMEEHEQQTFNLFYVSLTDVLKHSQLRNTISGDLVAALLTKLQASPEVIKEIHAYLMIKLIDGKLTDIEKNGIVYCISELEKSFINQ